MKLKRHIAGQVYAWLLLLPAAILMIAFTHFPIVGGFISSFFSTAREGRPAKFIGLDNYAAMIADHFGNQCKTQAGPVDLGGDERIEEMLAKVFGDAVAVIFDGDDQRQLHPRLGSGDR